MTTEQALDLALEEQQALLGVHIGLNTRCVLAKTVLTFLKNWEVGSWKQWIVKLVVGWLEGWVKGNCQEGSA